MTGKGRTICVAFAFLGLLFVMQPVAMADNTLELLSPANLTGFSMGGVDTSPYNMEYDGSSQLALSCDDYLDNINSGDTWDVNTYTLAQVTPTGPQLYQSSGAHADPNLASPNIEVDYVAAAILVNDVLSLYHGNSTPAGNAAAIGQYSYALWNIFDTGAVPDLASAGHDPGDATQALLDMNAAVAQASTLVSEYTQAYLSSQIDLVIYTPVHPSVGPPANPDVASGDAPQEFLTVGGSIPLVHHIPVPEGSSLSGLAVELSALLGGIFLVRRRSRRNAA